MDEFITMYPGLYLDEEKAAYSSYRAQIAETVKRSALSVDELIATAPGAGTRGMPSVLTAAENEVQAKMLSIDPWNPLYYDKAYAESTSYGGLITPVTWACPKGGFFGGLNPSFGDLKTVREHHHYCTFHQPIMQGDVLYPVVVDMDIYDATPHTGSKYRTWALRGTGKVYNQQGQLVMTQTCGVKECFKVYADPEKRTWNAHMEDFDWSNHKFHSYTDSDWDRIRALWSSEKLTGADTLYFDDVAVGDYAPSTVDGPYTVPEKSMLICSPSQSDFYLRAHWGEADLELTKDDFGRYHCVKAEAKELAEKRAAMANMPPRGPKPGEGPKEGSGKERIDNSPPAVRGRASFENYTGRDSGVRAIMNWIGDDGRIVNLSWCIGSEKMMDVGMPDHPNHQSPLNDVPGMEGRRTDIHGEEGDTAINRIYIKDKRPGENGRGLVDIVWWTETIEGQIYTEGSATVALKIR